MHSQNVIDRTLAVLYRMRSLDLDRPTDLSADNLARWQAVGRQLTNGAMGPAPPRTGESAGTRDRQCDRLMILSIGDDPYLLESRQRVLESARYRVRSIPGRGIVEDEGLFRVDLALICHSVEDNHAAAMVASLHRLNPAILVLRLTTPDFLARDCFDRQLMSPSPEDLLTTIKQMIAVRLTWH